MSKYTTEVRNICETYAGRNERGEYPDIETCVNAAYTKIFDVDNIPVYVPEHKPLLLKKILLHYYQREIAYETVGLWKFKLNTKLKEIMPYYNQLYASELLEYDPLQNVNNWHEHEGIYEDTSKVDNKRKYDNQTDTDNTEIAEKTRKFDESVDTDNSKASNRNLGTGESSTDAVTSDTTGNEQVLLKHKKSITQESPDTVGHSVTQPRDQWTLYSDTPQGGITGLTSLPVGSGNTSGDGNNYLTNATHVLDSAGAYTDTTTRGEVTEQYNKNDNSLKDVTDRTGHEYTTDQFRRDTTEAENKTAVEQGNRDTDALTHDNAAKISDGTRVDDALTVDDNLRKDNGTDAHTNREYGKIGVLTYQEMVLKYRETFLNIDMMIIEECKDLFMKVW